MRHVLLMLFLAVVTLGMVLSYPNSIREERTQHRWEQANGLN